MKLITRTVIVAALTFPLVQCDDANVASRNLSKAADNFEIMRKIVFYNTWTDTYMMEIEGLCSIEDQKSQLEVVCKRGPSQFSKDFLGLSGQVSYFVQQMVDADVSTYHYRVVWKPQVVVPEIDLRGDLGELTTSKH